jgi:hypothetical protein
MTKIFRRLRERRKSMILVNYEINHLDKEDDTLVVSLVV